MSKSKINLEELSKDMDEIFNMLKEFEEKSLLNLDMDKFNKKAEYIKQKLEKKYPKNLDSKK
jgi:hypothetical protein